MFTQADERLQTAREGVQMALKALSEIVIDGIPGSTEYKVEYSSMLKQTLIQLLDIQEKLA